MTEHPLDDEKGLLAQLDGPRIGLGLAALAILILALWGLKLWDDLNGTVERLDALVQVRLEEAQASDRKTVETCFASANQAPVLNRVLLRIEEGATSAQAKDDIAEFRGLIAVNSPTLRECRQLAAKLKVKPRGG